MTQPQRQCAQQSPAGRFVTFEGIDGAGKSSHLGAVAERWRGQGLEVVQTREPGGTPLAEALRAIVLEQPMDALTEALIVFAARRDHLVRCIEPALARGALVLSDRFTDASFAYQGGGRGLPMQTLQTLQSWVQSTGPGTGPKTGQPIRSDPASALRLPDLTVWFDLDPQTAAARLAGARTPDRFERQDLAFFQRVAASYRAAWEAEPQRIVRIDAGQPQAAVAAQLDEALSARGW